MIQRDDSLGMWRRKNGRTNHKSRAVGKRQKGLDQADPKAQFLKVAEEFGEIASAMARSNDELFKDSVGDVIVTLIILSMQKGTNVQECLEMAYNEIKGRTGKMVDGVFVKSSDLEEQR